MKDTRYITSWTGTSGRSNGASASGQADSTTAGQRNGRLDNKVLQEEGFFFYFTDTLVLTALYSLDFAILLLLFLFYDCQVPILIC